MTTSHDDAREDAVISARLDRAFAALQSAGCNPKRSELGISSLCPIDGKPSLIVSLGQEFRIRITCNEECTMTEIVERLKDFNVGLPFDDLEKENDSRKSRETPTGETGTPGRRPVSTRLSDVEVEVVRWVWRGRIPLGKVTIVDGDPDLGKSTLTLDLAARVTIGSRMPDETTSDLDGPANVILISIEDGAADTIRPRADAAGADVSRVHLLNDVEIEDDKGIKKRLPWVMPRDLDMLGELVEITGAKLVILDPLVGVVDGSVNLHNDQDTRAALRPLATMADQMGFAVIALRHINKGGGQNAKHRGGGSIAIIGAARSGLLVGLDPDDETGETKVIATVKHNLSKTVPSLKYRLVSDRDNPAVARIEWLGESPFNADALLAEPQTEDQRIQRDDIVEIITELTADGPCTHEGARAQIKAAGYRVSDSTISRAIRQAGCVTEKAQGFGGKRSIRRIDADAKQSNQTLQSSPDVTVDATDLTRENDPIADSLVTTSDVSELGEVEDQREGELSTPNTWLIDPPQCTSE